MVRYGMRAFALLTLLVPLLLSSCNSGGGTATSKLRVTITGLPSGAEAAVTVSGPGNYSQKLTATQTLSGAAPGSYTITPRDVQAGNRSYHAVGGKVRVQAGQTAKASVNYAPIKDFSLSMTGASLSVPFDGSAALTVHVTRAPGFTGAVTLSLSNPPTGISAAPITIPGDWGSGKLTVSSTARSIGTPLKVTVQGESGSLSRDAALTATVVPVVTSMGNSGPGTLRDLMTYVPTSSASPTTITFDPAVFNKGTTIKLYSPLTLTRDLNVQGPKSVTVTLSGGDAVQVLDVNHAATATLANLTIAGGNDRDASHYGGGIFNHGALTLKNVTVGNNAGGGIENDGTLTLVNSTVSGNTNDLNGGGVDNGGTLTLTNSTVSNNTAAAGGGIYNDSGTITATLTNSTVSGNTATTDGGGIYNAGTLNIESTIVASNMSATPTGNGWDISNNNGATLTSDGYNLIRDGGGSNTTWLSSDLVGFYEHYVEPDLGPLQDNGGPTETMALQAGSPAIDQIPASDCTDIKGNAVTTDQRGDPRPSPAGGMCDIGAFEVQQ